METTPGIPDDPRSERNPIAAAGLFLSTLGIIGCCVMFNVSPNHAGTSGFHAGIVAFFSGPVGFLLSLIGLLKAPRTYAWMGLGNSVLYLLLALLVMHQAAGV